MIFQIYSVVSFKLIPIDVLGVLLHLRIPVSGVMSHYGGVMLVQRYHAEMWTTS